MTLISRVESLRRRLPENVNLLAVSKGHPASSIRSVANFGQIDFGESRLQEALPKFAQLNDLIDLKWHFVGRLQRNKVRAVVKKFDFIHSVDSIDLAERISRISQEENRFIKVMLQVKFLEDENKGGFQVDDLIQSCSELKKLPNIQLIGLMTIPPLGLALNRRKNVFKQCRDLSNAMGLKECSMGMSGDWEEAIESGATWIRIGSLLFGERSK